MARRSHLLLAAALAVLAACQSTDPVDVPPRENTPEEESRLKALRDADTNMGPMEDTTSLFITIDQNLRSWRELSASGNREDRLKLDSLEQAMTRLVYLNFDAILRELDSVDPERRVTAAAALGFSHIPAPDEPGGDPDFPTVHQRAVQPLVDALDDGSDALTQNALLSLARIGSPDTPHNLVLEILVAHHNAQVRSNAGFALSRLLTPQDAASATSYLYAALEDEDPKVRLHAVSALGAIHDKTSVGQILGVFTGDESPLVRANAARILGNLGDPAVVPYLAQGMRDKTPVIRLSCHQSLVNLADRDLGTSAEEWMRWYRDNYDG